MVWFEARMDDSLVLHNRPGEPSHWGQQVFAFMREKGVPAGGTLEVELSIDDGRMHARLAG
jgi:hypothetical protein